MMLGLRKDHVVVNILSRVAKIFSQAFEVVQSLRFESLHLLPKDLSGFFVHFLDVPVRLHFAINLHLVQLFGNLL